MTQFSSKGRVPTVYTDEVGELGHCENVVGAAKVCRFFAVDQWRCLGHPKSVPVVSMKREAIMYRGNTNRQGHVFRHPIC